MTGDFVCLLIIGGVMAGILAAAAYIADKGVSKDEVDLSTDDLPRKTGVIYYE